MAGIPKVKITFDADFDELKKGVKGAQNEVEGFSDRIGKFGKVAAAAFAAASVAAAAYAGKLLIDGVKSAIEDEAAQAKLATTLQNVTGATDAQIKAVEDQITKTALLTGITDDELRPSFDRLLRATKDITKAQNLQAIAIDVAAGSGKSLEAVTEAMSKAAEGNTASLARLGVGLSRAELATLSMDQITAKLASTFEGQASKQADTFQGKMARLTVAFDEAKETVGSYVLDAITPLISSFVDKGIPAIQNFASGLSVTLGPAFTAIFKVVRDDLLPIVLKFWNFLATEFIPALGAIFGPALKGLANAFNIVKNAVSSNSDELAPLLTLFKAVWSFTKDNLAPILGGAFKIALEGIATLVGGLITAFGKFVSLLTSIYNGAKRVIDLIKDNPVTNLFGGGNDKSLKAGVSFTNPVLNPKVSGDFGNEVMAGLPDPTELFNYKGEMVKGVIDATGISDAESAFRQREALLFRLANPDRFAPIVGPEGNAQVSNNNVTVNMGIVGDPESAARTIIDVLNKSQARGTGGAGLLVP